MGILLQNVEFLDLTIFAQKISKRSNPGFFEKWGFLKIPNSFNKTSTKMNLSDQKTWNFIFFETPFFLKIRICWNVHLPDDKFCHPAISDPPDLQNLPKNQGYTPWFFLNSGGVIFSPFLIKIPIGIWILGVTFCRIRIVPLSSQNRTPKMHVPMGILLQNAEFLDLRIFGEKISKSLNSQIFSNFKKLKFLKIRHFFRSFHWKKRCFFKKFQNWGFFEKNLGILPLFGASAPQNLDFRGIGRRRANFVTD